MYLMKIINGFKETHNIIKSMLILLYIIVYIYMTDNKPTTEDIDNSVINNENNTNEKIVKKVILSEIGRSRLNELLNNGLHNNNSSGIKYIKTNLRKHLKLKEKMNKSFVDTLDSLYAMKKFDEFDELINTDIFKNNILKIMHIIYKNK